MKIWHVRPACAAELLYIQRNWNRLRFYFGRNEEKAVNDVIDQEQRYCY